MEVHLIIPTAMTLLKCTLINARSVCNKLVDIHAVLYSDIDKLDHSVAR